VKVPILIEVAVVLMTHKSVFLEEINLASREIFDKAAVNNQIIDFHDIMLRFAMDSFSQ
jgi:hypothetical protein